MKEKYRKEFVKLMAKIKSPKLMDEFMRDILTPAEYEEIVKRWQIVKELSKGIPQRKIAKNLGISIATITRGSREMRDKNGGFKKVLKMKI